MAGLKALRRKHGLSQYGLADLIGDQQPNVSALESGRRTMSMKVANKVLRELEESEISAHELIVANRLRAFKRAKEGEDVSAMLGATEVIYKTISDHGGATEEAAELLRELVGEVETAMKGGFDDDRDLYGRVVTKSGDLDSDSRDLYGRRIPDSKHYDDEDDGRDMFGRVITPFKDDEEEYDDEEDFEDEDDGRDAFGRVI